MSDRRLLLLKSTKYLAIIMLLAIMFVSFDYLVDFRPSTIHSSYRFTLRDMSIDKPLWLRQDNLTILIIARSESLIEALKQSGSKLQDPDSESSRQPPYAKNQLRSRHEAYFVAYGWSTDLECPLQLGSGFTLKETCGTARYDFAGRALAGKNKFQNLVVPDYTFRDNFTLLTINP